MDLIDLGRAELEDDQPNTELHKELSVAYSVASSLSGHSDDEDEDDGDMDVTALENTLISSKSLAKAAPTNPKPSD